LKNHLAALKISEEIGDKQMIAASRINIGVTNIHLKKFPEAKQFLNDGLSLSKEIGSKNLSKLVTVIWQSWTALWEIIH
jgi:hypothetical protein